MRYFLLTAEIIVNSSSSFKNTIHFPSENFPSLTLMKDKIVSSYELYSGIKVDKSSGLAILNLFEFKNEKDYNDYNGIETPPIEKEMD